MTTAGRPAGRSYSGFSLILSRTRSAFGLARNKKHIQWLYAETFDGMGSDTDCNKLAQHITPTVSTFEGFGVMEVYNTLCNTKMIVIFMAGYPLFYRMYWAQYTWITRVLRNQCIWQCNIGFLDLYAHVQLTYICICLLFIHKLLISS